MVEDVPVAPTVYRYALMAVNKRVVNYTIDPADMVNKYPWVWGVSDKNPIVEFTITNMINCHPGN